jgi:branched-chain amino acid transport system permease protein
VVLLMIWLPDGLLSIPDRLKAKRMAKEASAARAALGNAAVTASGNAAVTANKTGASS